MTIIIEEDLLQEHKDFYNMLVAGTYPAIDFSKSKKVNAEDNVRFFDYPIPA